MGDLPAQSNMVSAIITSPKFGQVLGKNESFDISVQYANLAAGVFTNPTTTYFAAPQQLDDSGNVIGHSHVTVQNIGALNPSTPPDAQTFDFFLGIDDDGNGQGLLTAAVDTGLLPGTYRVCTITSASNHQVGKCSNCS
jgi:transcription initiation factor TFIID subunit 15